MDTGTQMRGAELATEGYCYNLSFVSVDESSC